MQGLDPLQGDGYNGTRRSAGGLDGVKLHFWPEDVCLCKGMVLYIAIVPCSA